MQARSSACTEENDVGVITFFSLAAGFLTAGKYRSESDFAKNPRGSRSIPRYIEPARHAHPRLSRRRSPRRSAPNRQLVALAWLMRKAHHHRADRLVQLSPSKVA